MKLPELSSGFIKTLSRMKFDGNVRELISIINRCISSSAGSIFTFYLLRNVLPGDTADLNISETDITGQQTVDDSGTVFPETLPGLKAWSNLLVDEALRRTDGNITSAASLIGISQPALSKRIAKR